MSRTYRSPLETSDLYWSQTKDEVGIYKNLNEFNNRVYQYHLNGYRFWLRHYAVQTDEEIREEAKETYTKYQRDGRNGLSCTSAKSGFKRTAAKKLRRLNKKYAHDVMCDNQWEDNIYPCPKMAKTHKWDYW